MGKFELSEKLKSIKPYIVDKTKYDIRLDANESFLPFPEEMKEELCKALLEVSFNRYPDAEAEELCRLFAAYCGVQDKNVMAGNGSDETIQILMNGFLDSGDTVLTIKPDFSMYKFYASLMGAQVVEYEMSENLNFDKAAFVNMAKAEKARLIIFSNPCNPTGGVISREDILYIVENTEALVVVDEAYFEFYGETVIDKLEEYENLAVLRTCSKAIGMAAARVGFLIANEEIIKNAKKVKPPFNVNSLTQAAAVVILKNTDIINSNIKKIVTERDYLYKELVEIGKGFDSDKFKVYPTYSNFVFIKSSVSKEIYEYLKAQNIVIRFFGEHLRINAGSRAENDSLLSAIKLFLKRG